MDSHFYIMLNVKTIAGLERYGKFFLGDDQQVAYHLFEQLKGDREVNEKNILYIELMETQNNGLPVNLKLLSCTLDELMFNCRLITKEVFKFYNLKENK